MNRRCQVEKQPSWSPGEKNGEVREKILEEIR